MDACINSRSHKNMIRMARINHNSSKWMKAKVEGRMKMTRRGMLCLTAAAALTARSDAFVPPPLANHGQHHRAISTAVSSQPLALLPKPATTTCTIGTRMYATGGKEEDGILKKIAKKILPKSWVQSEEQRAELAKQKVKDEVSGGIQEMLRDAPLPIKMMGRMISPLLSKMASEMSESMAEQQRTIEELLDDSRACILGDSVAMQCLGEPITVGAPFSQSSSTSIINGQKSMVVELGFPVQGSRSSGVATARATQDGISSLVLQVDGRQIQVSLAKRGSPSKIGRNHLGSGFSDDDDNVIEAEIIEKDVRK